MSSQTNPLSIRAGSAVVTTYQGTPFFSRSRRLPSSRRNFPISPSSTVHLCETSPSSLIHKFKLENTILTDGSVAILIFKPVNMIFVGGSCFDYISTQYEQESNALVALLEHPILVSAANALKAIPEKLVSVSQQGSNGFTPRKHVYLFQREFATVHPALVDFIGTDEATTCVGIVIRNRDNGMISVAHMDSPKVVNAGLSQMLGEVVGNSIGSDLDVHLIGGFEDTPSKEGNQSNSSHSESKLDGYSLPLCVAIINALEKRREKLHIQTLFVLEHNTRRDSEGFSYPIFTGLLMETATGSIIPARFDATTRCPDELVRRIRISASFQDSRWRGKLLETYDTQTDQFIICSCYWNLQLVHMASVLQQLPDSEILQECSTSPTAEAPDFIYNQRRLWDYLIQHPNWNETFPMGKARVFKRVSGEEWAMVE